MNSLLRVLSYLKPFRMLAVVTFVCAGLATALELVPPDLVKIVIDDVIQSKRPELLPWVLGALLGSYVLRNLMSSMRVRFNNLLEQKAVHALRMQVFGALQRLSLSYFENRSTGEIMTRVTSDTEHVERIFVDGLEGLLTASLTLVGITIMMFFLNWKLALLSLLPIPILIVCAAWFTKRVHGYYAEMTLKDPRSAFLAVYALCGFAHIPSLAIFVGGTAALAPGRAGDISRVAFRALIAATLACFMTAAVAGTFFTEGSGLLMR